MEPQDPGSTDVPHTPEEQRVADFWNLARFHANLSQLPAYFGVTALESIPPPTWSFGEGAQADELLDSLLADGATTSTVAREDLAATGAEEPSVGTLGIVLDSQGEPRALVVTSEVDESDTEVVEHLTVLYQAE